MTRVLADLPPDDLRWLDERAAKLGRSRASMLREAVATFRSQAQSEDDRDWLDRGFGLWKDRTDIGDAVEWQRRERASWTRPWDDDYEEVKAEFPDLFDAEDDRQRQIYVDMVAGKYPDPIYPDPA
ncbi:ribbon-helix-helix protein, CopG family [Sphingomonas melonis]|uniref:Putative transcriptional regulator n=1 Tax=Sphingomonas melonis TaxID=152682 RepID=A0A7Y9FL33_9SPHN|nr:ribbon-helix-helix protein, CopG family [Sphingomonas melonis]NYD89303.1 putative transcriptional regulator [Sphingomonas melonis]